jgi:hypothetical protein
VSKKKSEDSTANKILWYGGAAAVGAFTMYYVNKMLKDREDLQMMRLGERQAKLRSLDVASESSE